MTRTLLITAALCLSPAAYAGGTHDQQHGQPQQPSYTATANNTAVAGAAARSMAASQARSVAGATGGAASAQGGRGGAGGSASNGGQTMNYSGGSTSYSARGNTPDAIAPSIATANDCALPKSVGFSLFGWGASGGFANESDACKRQRLAAILMKMGDARGAREALCLEEDMRRAAYSSGAPCAADARGWNRR